jgi:hypothetical protein
MGAKARARTLAHMNEMIAAAVASTACAQPDTQTVTITPLPTVPSTADTTLPPPPTASATFAPPPPPPPPPPDPSGYLVVDMMPAPARCMGLAGSSSSTAKFRRDGTGLVVDFVVTLASSSAQPAKFTGQQPGPMSGVVVTFTYRSGSTIASVRVRPTLPSSSLGLSLQVSCGSRGTGTLFVTATYAGTAAEGVPLTTALSDY